jgi:hypothetical protein
MSTQDISQPKNPRRVPWFGARKMARELAAEIQELRKERDAAYQQLERLGALSLVQLEARRGELEREIADQTNRISQAYSQGAAGLETLQKQVIEARQSIVATEDLALLQEAGIYHYRHPLTDAVAYQQSLKLIEAQIKSMIKKDGGAVLAATNWTVNGSVTPKAEQWSGISPS